MTIIRIDHRHPQIALIVLVAFSLLLAGMRVPDLSRPHRPRPLHRLVLEAKHKTLSTCLKQQSDPVTVLPDPCVSIKTITYEAVSQAVPPLCASPLSLPRTGRSPPAPET